MRVTRRTRRRRDEVSGRAPLGVRVQLAHFSGKETGGGPGEEPPPEVAEAGLVRDEPIPLRRVRPVAWRRTRPSPRGGTGHSISRDSRVRSHRNPAELPARGAGEAVGAPRRAGSVVEPKKHTPSHAARSARAAEIS